MSFKREILLSTEGFDTRFTGNAFREETDFCLSLIEKGHRLVYRHGPTVKHYAFARGGCRDECHIKDSYIYYQNQTLFFLKHWSALFLGLFIIGQIKLNFFDEKDLGMKRLIRRVFALFKGIGRGIRVYLTKRQFNAYEIKEDRG